MVVPANSTAYRPSAFHFTLAQLLGGVLYICLLLGFYQFMIYMSGYRVYGFLDVPAHNANSVQQVLALYQDPVFVDYGARLLVDGKSRLAKRPWFSVEWFRKHVVFEMAGNTIIRITCFAPTYDEAREAGGAMLTACAFLPPNASNLTPLHAPAGGATFGGIEEIGNSIDPRLTEVRQSIYQTIHSTGFDYNSFHPVPSILVLSNAELANSAIYIELFGDTVIWVIAGWLLLRSAIRRNRRAAAMA